MAHPIIARLEAIKAAFFKKAVQKQDVVDFYLLSLLPEEWLAKSEIGPDHLNGRVLFDAIIMALREEYISRGMDELKDEAETTRWQHEVRDGDIDEHLKPYFTFHESGYSGNDGDDDDDEDSEPDYDTSCESCGNGLYEDDAYGFNETTYCSDCHANAVADAVSRNTTYCKTHDKFLVPNWIDDEGETPHGADVESNHERPCEVVSGREGEKIHDELKQNQEKQMRIPYKDDLYKNPPDTTEEKPTEPIKMPNPQGHAVTQADLNTICTVCGQVGGAHPVTGDCPAVPGGMFTRPAFNPGKTVQEWTQSNKNSRWLEIKAHRRTLYAGTAYWEAPSRFDGYSSTDYFNVFNYANWRQSYGGPLWAEVARTINQMENTTDPKKVALLIDHFHDLGHNTGKLLDKFPEWHKWFKDLLDLKASKDSVRRLVPMASTSVAKLVTEYYKLNRGENWRTPNYPRTDFSKSDLNSIYKDPNPPMEVLENAIMFMSLHGGGYISEFLHKLDDKALDSVMAKLQKAKKGKKPDEDQDYFGVYQQAESIWEKRHKWEEIPSVSSKVPKLEKKADEWQGQRDAQPFGTPPKGMWSDPAVKEGAKPGASLSDAIKFFIEHGDRFNKKPTEIDLTSKFVKWSDGSRSTFDEFVELYSHHISKKDADFGMMDGPVDQGRHHDGDFPSASWMPSGEEDKGVDSNYTSANLIQVAVNSILASTFKDDLLEAPAPVEHGSKEVSKYEPEGEFLMRLVDLLVKEGVSQEDLIALVNAHPVVTIDDAGDLAAQLWTLATTKYKIPREWLMRKMPDIKGHLTKKADSLQRGNAYVIRSVDTIDVEVDSKVEAILKSALTDDQKFDAIVERIKEMFYELDDTATVMKNTEWDPGEVDGSDVQGVIDAHNEAIEEAFEEAAHDAMTTEEEDQSYDRLSKPPWKR